MDLPFEYGRYRPIRKVIFNGTGREVLDAGVGTGRNMPFYPPEGRVTGIDLSPSMLARAEKRKARLGVSAELCLMDILDTDFTDARFDFVIATFLFCVFEDADQLPALLELGRVCKPDGEKVVNRVHAEAAAAVVKLTTEAKRGVGDIRKDAARAAADLVREGKTGGDSKRDALAAEKIIKEAGKAAEELNQKAADALKALSEEAEAIAFNFKRITETAARELTEAEKEAVKKVSDAGRNAAAKFPTEPKEGDPDNEALKEERLAAAEIIKALAQAADDVHRASMLAVAKIQKASEDAQLSMRKASKKAATLINEAIDEANEKIIRTTEKAILDAVGKEEAEFFDLGPLKEKWVKREK